MASQPVRAIYQDGQLRLLDPVDLAEGQEVHLVIMSEVERVRAALADLLVSMPPLDDDEFDEAALQRELDEWPSGVTLSDVIIEERNEGP